VVRMAAPRLLLEAASSYRGDMEDRLPDIFAVALDAHDGFCRAFAARPGRQTEPAAFRITTQRSFNGQMRVVDVVIDCMDRADHVAATIFRREQVQPRWR
jgi:hypothetical protein